ncbi:hypothetical protein CRG98_050316, partial [Punica granatum]
CDPRLVTPADVQIVSLKLNLAKIELFSAGLEKNVETAMLKESGFRKGQLPVRYLGVALVSEQNLPSGSEAIEAASLWPIIQGLMARWAPMKKGNIEQQWDNATQPPQWEEREEREAHYKKFCIL